MSFADQDGYIWKNGEWCEWRDANLHVLSHGLHYGSCVFEGVRAYNGNIYKLREHSERLLQSGRYLGMSIPYSSEELDEICEAILQKNNLKDAYLRPFAWRGSEMMAISAQHTQIHVAVAAWKWPNYFDEEKRKNGIATDFADWRRPDPKTIPWQSKASGLYMICTLSKHKVESEGFDDAIMLDHRGYLAEATGANLFLVIDGALHTPLPDCFLDGITRQAVIRLAKANGFAVFERHIQPEELSNASEVFICGTAAEVMRVNRIGDHYFNGARVCDLLSEAYMHETREGG